MSMAHCEDIQHNSVEPDITMELADTERINSDECSVTVVRDEVDSNSNIITREEERIHQPDTIGVTLPHGMLYHVYFSHTYKDRGWVKEMLRKLEAPPYNMRCCFADRDFTPGVPTLDNMSYATRSSLKIVMVLSPDFVEDSLCEHEIRMTLDMGIRVRRRSIIPVMLRPCRPPDFLGRLSYIEVGNEHFWENFVSAIRTNVTMEEVNIEYDPSGITLFQHPFYHNLDKLAKITIARTFTVKHFKDKCPVPNELTSSKISVKDFNSILSMLLTKQRYVACNNRFRSVMYAVMYTFFFHTISFFSLSSVKPSLSFLTWTCSGIFIISLISRLYCCYSSVKPFTEVLIKANLIASRYNLMIGCKRLGISRNDKVTIIFYYYDWRLCRSYLQDSNLSEGANVQGVDDNFRRMILITMRTIASDDENLVKKNIFIELLCYTPDYVTLFEQKTLSRSLEQRHTCHVECLCQFVESLRSVSQSELTSFSSIFGVRSRHPYKRYFSFYK